MKSFFGQFDYPLVVLDLANNHNGDLSHAKSVIDQASVVMKEGGFPFAIKFQYRDLDTFIHQQFRGDHSFPYIKRFESTRLTWEQFQELVDFVRQRGGLTACTPFDEASVERIVDHGFDILKIASASFSDWPLLEKVVSTDLPILASTAGASLDVVDRVASFFGHRNKDFALMHCVAAYPTMHDDLQLNRIDLLRERYSPIPVGYSTHEDPEDMDAVKIAIAKGASILERHIGIETATAGLNAYSSSPDTLREWVRSIDSALRACGRTDNQFSANLSEVSALNGLRRGVFLKNSKLVGERINDEDVFFAIPLSEGQVSANDWSKYLQLTVLRDLSIGDPLDFAHVEVVDHQDRIRNIVESARRLFREANVVLPARSDLEISHHYGLEKFEEFGLLMLTVVNRDYCKKLLGLLPGQQHPEQWHEMKEETFNCLYGQLDLRLDGEWFSFKPGESVTVQPGVRHYFKSEHGCVIEEISTTHQKADSFYTDLTIMNNKDRKTFVDFWL